jgi:uncharacterized protein
MFLMDASSLIHVSASFDCTKRHQKASSIISNTVVKHQQLTKATSNVTEILLTTIKEKDTPDNSSS